MTRDEKRKVGFAMYWLYSDLKREQWLADQAEAKEKTGELSNPLIVYLYREHARQLKVPLQKLCEAMGMELAEEVHTDLDSMIYLTENQEIAEKAVEAGCTYTEYRLQTKQKGDTK